MISSRWGFEDEGNAFNDLDSEPVEAREVGAGVGQEAESGEAKVPEDLPADPELSQDAMGEPGRVGIGRAGGRLEPGFERVAFALLAEVDDGPAALAPDGAHGGTEMIARRRVAPGLDFSEDVPEEVAAVHPNEDGVVDGRTPDTAEREDEVGQRIDQALEDGEIEDALGRP